MPQKKNASKPAPKKSASKKTAKKSVKKIAKNTAPNKKIQKKQVKPAKAAKQTKQKKASKKKSFAVFSKLNPIKRIAKVKDVTVDLRKSYVPVAILISGLMISCSIIIAFSDRSIPFLSGDDLVCDSDEPLSDECLKKYAREADLNTKKFDKCLEDEKYSALIDKEIANAEQLGVQGTPYVVIGQNENGKIRGFYAGGAQGYDFYKGLIEKVKSQGLDKAKDELLAERYGSVAELTAKYKEAYQEQGVSGAQLDQYAKAAAEEEYARYTVQEYTVGDGITTGKDGAKIVLMVFSDFECPYCQSFAQTSLVNIKKDYIDKGDVRLVFHNFPLESIHPKARAAALAGRCANEQGKFMEYHDYLYQITKLED